MNRRILGVILLFGLSASGAFGTSGDGRANLTLRWFSTWYQDESLIDRSFRPHKAGERGFHVFEGRFGWKQTLSRSITLGFGLDAFYYPDGLSARAEFPERGSDPFEKDLSHFEIHLEDAWIRFADPSGGGWSLTLGRQRIAWGAAPRFSVLDDLNPPDFARWLMFDPEHAGTRWPQWAVNAEYRFGSSRLQIVGLLSSQEATIPRGYAYLLRPSKRSPEMILSRSWEEEGGAGGLRYGLRWSTSFREGGFSVSYCRGNYPLPTFYGWNMDFGPKSYFLYLGRKVLGADAFFRVGPVRIWGEGGVVFPEKRNGFLEFLGWTGQGYGVLRYEFPLFKGDYLKYAAGWDADFGPAAAGVGYLHGFVDEFPYSQKALDAFGFDKGMFFGPLEDYLTAFFALKNDRWPVLFRADALRELAGEEKTLLLCPDLIVKIRESIRLRGGAFLVLSGSAETTKFGLFKQDSFLFAGVEFSF